MQLHLHASSGLLADGRGLGSGRVASMPIERGGELFDKLNAGARPSEKFCYHRR